MLLNEAILGRKTVFQLYLGNLLYFLEQNLELKCRNDIFEKNSLLFAQYQAFRQIKSAII